MLGTNVACHTFLKRAAVGACMEAHSFCGACIVSRAGSQWSHNPTHVCALHHDVQEAVRALKRRVAELEAQLQQEDAQRRGLAEQLQEAWQEQQARAGESAGAVARLEQELRGGLLGWKGVCVDWVGVWVCGYLLEVGGGVVATKAAKGSTLLLDVHSWALGNACSDIMPPPACARRGAAAVRGLRRAAG